MERAAEAAAERAHTRFIVADDADAVVEAIAPYVDEHGFTRLIFHFPADNQKRQIDAFCDDVLPRLRERW
jgi:coenzyme F420-dependent glucose-6-phosphate dehydrogenase